MSPIKTHLCTHHEKMITFMHNNIILKWYYFLMLLYYGVEFDQKPFQK